VRRPAIAAALVVAAAAAACSDTPAQACPGEPVARFHFTGSRVAAGDSALAGLDPVPLVEDCPAEVGPPPYPVSLDTGGAPSGFQGVLVEEMTQVAGDCGTCLAGSPPACAARYALQGTL
jgi:hypothetical protein